MQKSDQIQVQFSEEDGWYISETDLSQHISNHFDELHQSAMNRKDISQKKFAIVIAMIVAITLIIGAIALAGAHIFAFILALVALADVSPILSFLDRSQD